MAKKAIFKMAAAAIVNFKNFNFYGLPYTIWQAVL